MVIRRVLLVALLLAGATTLQAQGVPFFTEGWETNLTGSFNSTNFDRLQDQAEFTRQSGTVLAGGFSLAHAITSGAEPGFGTQHFGDAINGPVYAGTSGNHYDDLYVQWKVRYSAGFSFNVQYKQFIIGTEDDHAHDGPNPWAADYSTVFVGTDGCLKVEHNRKLNNNGSEWLDTFPASCFTINPNTTYTIEVRRKVNSPPADDGIFQLWVNGTEILNATGLRLRIAWTGTFGTTTTYKSNFLLLSDYANLPGASGTVYYDDVKMATSYIGTGSASYRLPRRTP